MTASRLLLGLIQPLLALLLLAGAPGAGLRAEAGALPSGIESAAKAVAAKRERARIVAEALGEPDRLDGDGGEPKPAGVAPAPPAPVLDRGRLVRIGRASYPTAPSHRPCAAPPTGPPLA